MIPLATQPKRLAEKVDEIYGPAFFVWATDSKCSDTWLVAIAKRENLLLDALAEVYPGETLTIVEVRSLLEILP